MTIELIEKYMLEAEQMIASREHTEHGLNILNNLLYEEPGYGRLHNHIGWAHLYYTMNIPQAEVHFRAAITFDHEFQAPYLHLGTLYFRQGNYGEAINILNQGLTKPMANRTAMLEMIAQSYELKCEFKLAIETYRQAKLASLSAGEMNVFSEGIKRCRKKRWAQIFA